MQHGKSQHQTYLGCACTFLIYPFLSFLVIYMIFLNDLSSHDKIYQSSQIFNNSMPNQGIQLNISGETKLDFVLMVNDEDFDNDDNPYGKFIYHMYSNMDNITDTATNIQSDKTVDAESVYKFEDRFIPLVVCPTETIAAWRKRDVK